MMPHALEPRVTFVDTANVAEEVLSARPAGRADSSDRWKGRTGRAYEGAVQYGPHGGTAVRQLHSSRSQKDGKPGCGSEAWQRNARR